MKAGKLSSPVFTILEINKATKAKLVCGFKVGDKFQILKNLRSWNKYIEIHHINSDQSDHKYYNQLDACLSGFVYCDNDGNVYTGLLNIKAKENEENDE